MSQSFSFDLKDTLSFSVIEGATPITDAANDLTSHPEYYDFSTNIVYPPGHPNYVPTLGESKLQDTTDLLAQENTIYALTAVAGVSLLLLSYMIAQSNS
jgi:hypothetical protein